MKGQDSVEYRKVMKEERSQFKAFRQARHLSSHEAAHRMLGFVSYVMVPTVKTVNLWPDAAVKKLRTIVT